VLTTDCADGTDGAKGNHRGTEALRPGRSPRAPGTPDAQYSPMTVDRLRGTETFLVVYWNREQGPLVARLLVSRKGDGLWQTDWDIGTIDKDYYLSDHWFTREEYEPLFLHVLEQALKEARSPAFDIPGATLRWGLARGMRRQNAVDLANQVLNLWTRIIVEWETQG
jgi:hypothetical protein